MKERKGDFLVPCVLLLFLAALHAALASRASHPRVFFDASDLPYLRAKARRPFHAAVLRQYSDALNHKLNYSAGGVMSDIERCSQCGWRHQLAATLFVADAPNATDWGQVAKEDVYKQITALNPHTGNWFAASERNLQQLLASYDVTAALFSPREAADVERSFALNANYLYASPPAGLGTPADMASRLMNPAADRLAALGLIALAFPNQPNASNWLAQSVREFRWMLANGVMEDGQWHEPSTRYHGRVLAAFVPFAFALRHAGIMDAFNEIIEFKKFLGWYRKVQTPPDATMGNCSLTPAISDSNWETVWQVSLGWSVGAYALTDPSYAWQLFRAWENACAPMGLEPSPPAMLASFLFVGCVREADGCGQQFDSPFTSAASRVFTGWRRQSALLSGYAVLEQPLLASMPYMIVSTSTQRQTEGHEHPDRGSFSLYSHGTPLVLDPGVGWCGYNWFGTIPPSRENGTTFDKGLQFGAWYRGSQAHSMVNFAAEGPTIKPENETWRPDGAYGHEWGMRGAAWVDNHLFTDDMDYVDINITRAVQSSQLRGVKGYHRRIFANRHDDTYLIWDDVRAPNVSDCAQATYNLHVVTQLGWPGVVGCEIRSRWGGYSVSVTLCILLCV